MIAVFVKKLTREEKDGITRSLGELRFSPFFLDTKAATLLVTEEKLPLEKLTGEKLVERVVETGTPYQLVHRAFRPEGTEFTVGRTEIGRENLTVIAGPCAVESEEQIFRTAEEVSRRGAHLLRGGAYKPRTSPYSFQGMGEKALALLARARELFDLPVVTEATSPENAAIVAQYADVVQIGARNMQNFELLKAVGKLGKPVLLKRGMSATVEDLLMAAEYILSLGNFRVILCERGIRSIERLTRNTLDLTAIPLIKELSHLPVIVDPSHGTGLREKVIPMARSAVACGADGVMVEVHPDPDRALSDGPQSLSFEGFRRLINELSVIGVLVGKELTRASKIPETYEQEKGVSQEDEVTVAFLGSAGSFSSQVARRAFGKNAHPLSSSHFREVFKSVSTGNADYGVVPLENTITGSIHANYDLLLEYSGIYVVGERFVRVSQHLGVFPGTRHENMQILFAHPQGFAQCGRFLENSEGVKVLNVGNTEEAARRAAEFGKGAGCISSEEAIIRHRLELLEEEIEDNPRNFTRFIILSRFFTPSPDDDKVSCFFTVANLPGSLFSVLKIFAEREVNLLKLESRPQPGKPWEYLFYVDWEGNLVEERFRLMVNELERSTSFFRVLGSFRNLWKKE